MIIKFLLASLVLMSTGCAVHYTFEGQKYGSKEEFHRAVESTMDRAVSEIVPFNSPISKKSLIFAIPSQQTIIDESRNRFVAMQGSQPTGNAKEIVDNISISNYRGVKVFFDAVQRKNIFSSVKFVEMKTMTTSFAAADDVDVLYMVEPSRGSAQWFYTSQKYGKQIFAYDRSSPTPEGKVQAFVDAVQAQAIRE